MPKYILSIKNRNEFRSWLKENSTKEKECYLILKRGKPKADDNFYYLDAVEEALCFGWIDSTLTKIDNKVVQRFSPRSKNSPWTELNKERVRRLIKLGLMEKEGYKTLPKLGERSFKINEEIKEKLKEKHLWKRFTSFPKLYQRVRAYNVYFYYSRDKKAYLKALDNLLKMTKENKMYGNWNDYGRLLDY